MYKVFQLENGKWQIFWCPSWPVHVGDKQPYSAKQYPHKQAAYYRCGQLNKQRRAVQV